MASTGKVARVSTEPITAITSITEPLGVKNVADVKINPATDDTLALVRTAVEIIDNFISGARGLVTEDNSAAILAKLDIATSALRDALLAGTVTYPGGLDDIFNKLNTQLDVLLSTRATEATLAAVRDRINELSAVLDSTTAVLAAAGTFTGLTLAVSGYGRIVGSCYADVAGTLRVEQRNDGTNFDVRSEFAYAAGALLGFSVEVVGNEARLVYVNGATAQLAFRLYTRARRI